MATHQGTRTPRTQTTPSRLLSKPGIYAAISDLNRDLELVLTGFRRLRQFGFRREFLDSFALKVEELRAESNGELLEMQLDRELKDWAMWDRLNRKFQSRYGDPDEALIKAKRIPGKRSPRNKPNLKSDE